MAKFTLAHDPIMDENDENVDSISHEDWKCLVVGIYHSITNHMTKTVCYHKLVVSNLPGAIYNNGIAVKNIEGDTFKFNDKFLNLN